MHDSDEAIIREALSSGHPWLEGITFERLMSDGWAKLNIPEPWLPYAEGGFPTASGRFEFASEAAAEVGLDPLPGLRGGAREPGRRSRPGGAISAGAHDRQVCRSIS